MLSGTCALAARSIAINQINALRGLSFAVSGRLIAIEATNGGRDGSKLGASPRAYEFERPWWQTSRRKKQADRDNDVCVRISEAQHLRWNEVTTLKKLPSDNARSQVSSTLDLAAEFDEGSDR